MMILCDSAAASAGRLQGSSRTKNKTRKEFILPQALMNLIYRRWRVSRFLAQ
jgi:hypothetical protein